MCPTIGFPSTAQWEEELDNLKRGVVGGGGGELVLDSKSLSGPPQSHHIKTVKKNKNLQKKLSKKKITKKE